MITTNDKTLAERFDNLKNPPAVNRPEERNGFSEISMNHRMSNLHAAVGVAQLERLESTIEKNVKMANSTYEQNIGRNNASSGFLDGALCHYHFII